MTALLTGRRTLGLILLVATIPLGVGAVQVHRFATASEAPAPMRPPSPLSVFTDARPVTITITTPSWSKVQLSTTADGLRSDHVLWRQMHFDDWDRVPLPLREEALRLMITANAEVFEGRALWRRMRPSDWDLVPQPVRAMSYLRMIWYWTRYEQVGAELGIEPESLAPTLAAIVMAESWFEHRAVNANEYGRDLGLAQCSDFCRGEIVRMALFGEIAFFPIEPDYFDPRTATRIATVWFERELLRSGGDVDRAIRAYHRGQDAAMDEKGTAYLARVLRLRERYIITQKASASWAFVARTIAPL
jgi:hypothetical protein